MKHITIFLTLLLIWTAVPIMAQEGDDIQIDDFDRCSRWGGLTEMPLSDVNWVETNCLPIGNVFAGQLDFKLDNNTWGGMYLEFNPVQIDSDSVLRFQVLSVPGSPVPDVMRIEFHAPNAESGIPPLATKYVILSPNGDELSSENWYTFELPLSEFEDNEENPINWAAALEVGKLSFIYEEDRLNTNTGSLIFANIRLSPSAESNNCITVSPVTDTNVRAHPETDALIVKSLSQGDQVRACYHDSTGNWVLLDDSSGGWINIPATNSTVSAPVNSLPQWSPPPPLVVADFNACDPCLTFDSSEMGPAFDEKSQNEMTVSYLNNQVVLTYSLEVGGWAAFWMKVDSLDAINYRSINLRLAASEPISRLKVELKQDSENFSIGYIYNITQGMQSYELLFKQLQGPGFNTVNALRNYTNINEIVLVVEAPENLGVPRNDVTIYVDDITLTP